jgi:hypothetical protein
MLTGSGLLIGFAYKAYAADEATTYVVNVCGHDSVGPPLAKSMNTVDDDYIEHNGVDNLIIPISVSEPMRTVKGNFAFCVDVVVHTVLIKKCTPKHHLFQHLTEKLLVLSMEWVQRECGVQLTRKGCAILGNPCYFSDVKGNGKDLEEVVRMAAELLKKDSANQMKDQETSTQLPDSLTLKKGERKESKRPYVQEVITSPGLKKGFLDDGKARLYGPEGSSEGLGKPPDPLAHIPESLRSKCRIIDTRNMEQSLQQTAKGHEKSAAEPTLVPTAIQNASASGCSNTEAAYWKEASFEKVGKALVVRFPVPEGVTSLRDVDLSATENTLEINGTVTKLPVSIDTDGVRAKFVRVSRVLVVTCPVDV